MESFLKITSAFLLFFYLDIHCFPTIGRISSLQRSINKKSIVLGVVNSPASKELCRIIEKRTFIYACAIQFYFLFSFPTTAVFFPSGRSHTIFAFQEPERSLSNIDGISHRPPFFLSSVSLKLQATQEILPDENSAFLNGLISGIATRASKEIILHPIDTIKARIQVKALSNHNSTESLYSNLFDGLLPALIGGLPPGNFHYI